MPLPHLAKALFAAHQFPQRGFHERDRAAQRLAICIAIVAVTMLHGQRLDDPSPALLGLPCATAVYAALSWLYGRLLARDEQAGVVTQYVFLVLDPFLTILALTVAPAVLAPLAPLLMVQIVRCGIRYGTGAMWLAWGSSVLAAFALMPLSAVWMGDYMLTATFGVTLAITPLCFAPTIARLHAATAELRAAATSDPLTGLGNRRMLAEHLRLAQQRCRRDGTMLAVMLFDLDNFKAVNDGLGHARGDALLARVASAVQAACRPGDFLARVGGDEFVLLVEGLAPASGQARAMAIAAEIGSIVRRAAEEICAAVPVTASVGVHAWHHAVTGEADAVHAAGAADLVERADRAMYAAKRAGKGRAVAAAA